MRTNKPAAADRDATFGQRKVAPRVCVANGKQHIRTFLREALEELGFITSECAAVDELPALLDLQVPDLVVLGMPPEGVEARSIMKTLVEHEFSGRVLLIGPRDSILVTAVRQFGEEFGIAMLHPLATPFSGDGLRASVATLLPTGAPPSPAVDVAEALKAGWLELWYQPRLMHTLAPRGAEALVRLRHPTWGVVSPAHFLPDDKDPQYKALSEFVVARALEDWHYFASEYRSLEVVLLPLKLKGGPAHSTTALARRAASAR